jgi:uncharacterized protein YeaO (DUF488 family)
MPHGLLTAFPRPVPDRTLQVARPTPQTKGNDVDDVFALARDLGICSPTWLRTGFVYGPQPGNAYAILVMPVAPDSTKRHNIYHAASTSVAPSLALYTAYRTGALTWHDFAFRYLAELDAKRNGALAQFMDQLCAIPARYSGALLLGYRHPPGGNEAHVRCPRRLLRAWLLDEVEHLPEVERSRRLPLPLPRPSPPAPIPARPHLKRRAC